MTSTHTFERTRQNLKQLKLATLREGLDDHLRLAQSKSLTYLEFLHGLTQEELRGREQTNYTRRLRGAKFPGVKTLEGFDFAFQPSLNPERVLHLKDGRWVANAENLVLAGQSGTGKTHLAIALGQKALELGYKVYFTGVADLLEQVNQAQVRGSVLVLQRKLLKVDVLILDEVGYLRINREQGNFLFRLISKAYEKQSLIITTNKDFRGWADIFEDSVQVAALLDRLLHHCHVFNLSGESYRIRNRNPSEEN